MKSTTVLIIFAMTVIAGFTIHAYAQEYYPNFVGNRWMLKNTDAAETHEVRVARQEMLSGRMVNVLERETRGGTDEFYIATEPDGIKLFRAIVSNPILGLLTFDYEKPQVFLPAPLAIGSTWTVSGKTQWKDFTIQSTTKGVVEAQEKVTGPAGTFLDCFKIRQDYLIEFPIKISVSTYMWLAPNIGLVKERDSNKVVFELAEYELFYPWDINHDMIVDIADLVLVGRSFGEEITAPRVPNPDVNADGIVDISDLVIIGTHFGESYGNPPAAPSIGVWKLDDLSQLHLLRQLYNITAETQPKTTELLTTQRLLKKLISRNLTVVSEFRLLQNFPNPFNPETWIPFALSDDSDVKINIYSSGGKLVRILHLGRKKAGNYISQDKAAYWDGKNNAGEKVANGVYFYQIHAGKFRATKRMVIAK